MDNIVNPNSMNMGPGNDSIHKRQAKQAFSYTEKLALVMEKSIKANADNTKEYTEGLNNFVNKYVSMEGSSVNKSEVREFFKSLNEKDKSTANDFQKYFTKQIDRVIFEEKSKTELLFNSMDKKGTELNKTLKKERELVFNSIVSATKNIASQDAEGVKNMTSSLKKIGLNTEQINSISRGKSSEEILAYIKDEQLDNSIARDNVAKDNKKITETQMKQMKIYGDIAWENHNKISDKVKNIAGGGEVGELLGNHLANRTAKLNPFRQDKGDGMGQGMLGGVSDMASRALGFISKSAYNSKDMAKKGISSGLMKVTKEGGLLENQNVYGAAMQDRNNAITNISNRQAGSQVFKDMTSNMNAYANKNQESRQDKLDFNRIKSNAEASGVSMSRSAEAGIKASVSAGGRQARQMVRDTADKSIHDEIAREAVAKAVADQAKVVNDPKNGRFNASNKNRKNKNRKNKNRKNKRSKSVFTSAYTNNNTTPYSTSGKSNPSSSGPNSSENGPSGSINERPSVNSFANVIKKVSPTKVADTFKYMHIYFKKLVEGSGAENLNGNSSNDTAAEAAAAENSSRISNLMKSLKEKMTNNGNSEEESGVIDGLLKKFGPMIGSSLGSIATKLIPMIGSGLAALGPMLSSAMAAIGPAVIAAAPFIAAAAAVAFATYKIKGAMDARDKEAERIDKEENSFLAAELKSGKFNKEEEKRIRELRAARAEELKDETRFFGIVEHGKIAKMDDELAEIKKNAHIRNQYGGLSPEEYKLKASKGVVSELAAENKDLTKENLSVQKDQKDIQKQTLRVMEQVAAGIETIGSQKPKPETTSGVAAKSGG